MTQIDKPIFKQVDDILNELINVACNYEKGKDVDLDAKANETNHALQALIATQIQEAYQKGYNDNARDCYCDSTKVIESLIPHKHLLDDDKSHDIRPNLLKGDR